MARHRAGRSVRVLLLSLLALNAQSRASEGEQWSADVVYLLDVSRSMQRADSLERGCALVRSHLERVVVPGTRVVLLPFGGDRVQGARYLFGADLSENAETRRAAANYLDALEPAGRPGDLAAALARGLELLAEGAREGVPRMREIILLSRGGVTGEDPSRLLARADAPGFRRGVDWRVTYAHFVEPDVRLRHALLRGAADAVVPLDRGQSTPEWSTTRLTSTNLSLGGVPFGEWRRKVRIGANSDRGALGKRIRLHLARGPLPEGLEVEIRPSLLKIESALQDFEFEVVVRGARPGSRPVLPLVVGGDPEDLHGVVSGRLDLEFEARRLRIDSGGGAVAFGSVSPGAGFRHAVMLRPESSGAALDAEVRLEWAKSDCSTWLSAPPVRLHGDGAGRLDLRLDVPADAPVGVGEMTVRLVSDAAVEFTPEWLTLTFEVEPGRVGAERESLSLAAATAGKVVEDLVNLRATPGAWGREIEIVVQQPEEGDCRFEVPAKVTLEETTPVPVRFSAEHGCPPGDRMAVLRLITPPGVKAEPHAIPLSARVLDATGTAIRFPREVEVGSVTPDDAGKVEFSLEFSATSGEAGGWLTLRSLDPEIALEGGETRLQEGLNVVKVRMHTGRVGFGRHACVLEAWLEHGASSGPVARTHVKWEVARLDPVRFELRVRVQSDPVVLSAGEERIVRVALDPRALEGAVDLRLEMLPLDLPAEILLDCPEYAKITGGEAEQFVPVRIRVGKNAPSGEWQPLLSVRSASAGVELDPITARVPVTVEAGLLARFGREILLGAIGLVVLVSMLTAYVLQRRRPEGVVHEVVRVQLKGSSATSMGARPTWEDEGFESSVLSRESSADVEHARIHR